MLRILKVSYLKLSNMLSKLKVLSMPKMSSLNKRKNNYKRLYLDSKKSKLRKIKSNHKAKEVNHQHQ
jgi:hypothetical protein